MKKITPLADSLKDHSKYNGVSEWLTLIDQDLLDAVCHCTFIMNYKYFRCNLPLEEDTEIERDVNATMLALADLEEPGAASKLTSAENIDENNDKQNLLEESLHWEYFKRLGYFEAKHQSGWNIFSEEPHIKATSVAIEFLKKAFNYSDQDILREQNNFKYCTTRETDDATVQAFRVIRESFQKRYAENATRDSNTYTDKIRKKIL